MVTTVDHPRITIPVCTHNSKVVTFTPEQAKARKLFSNRMAYRKMKHGENWRQVWVDCGGLCVRCNSTDYLEFHEPFGEEGFANGWGRFQGRILLCYRCHCEQHPQLSGEPLRARSMSLNDDVQIEIWMHGGWDKWLKDFKLQDTFGRLLAG